MEPTNQKPKRRPIQEARREEVAVATWNVIAEKGLEKASLRAIAAQMGCSTGVLMHHFADKDSVLAFALDGISTAIDDDLERFFSAPPTPERLADLIVKLLPIKAESIVAWKVWLAFTAAATTRPELGVKHSSGYHNLRDIFADIFRTLRKERLIPAKIDPVFEADMLICLLDGTGVQAIVSPERIDTNRQAKIIRAHVRRLASS